MKEYIEVLERISNILSSMLSNPNNKNMKLTAEAFIHLEEEIQLLKSQLPDKDE